jgi:hypothetical protein
VLDLTTAGASGSINGALFEQAAGSSTLNSFLRIQNNGQESGYNTDARPLQFDAIGNRTVTHALALTDVPVVQRNGVNYREFDLDVDDTVRNPQISLDQVKIFVGDVANLSNYNKGSGKLAGHTSVYDLDAGRGDNWVKLDSRSGNADGDMRMLVPDTAFAGAKYVYLFSQFGTHIRADGHAEEWGVKAVSPPAGVGSISGMVFSDFGQPAVNDGDSGAPGITVFLDTNGNGMLDPGELSTVTADGTTAPVGTYSFTNLPAGTTNGYAVRLLSNGAFNSQTTDNPAIIFLTPGQNVTGVDFGILPAD